MARSRTTEILDAWRALADGVALPTEAPKPSRHLYPFGIVAAAVVVVFLIVALSAPGQEQRPAAGVGGGIGAVPSATASAMHPVSTPAASIPATPAQTPAQVSSAAPLPSVGGTCTASQLVLGKPTSGYGYGSLGTSVVFVTQPVRNAGGSCALQLPRTIGVAPATGPFQPVRVVNTGTAASVNLRSGQSVKLVIGDSWWIRDADGQPMVSWAPRCANPISDVTRVEFPLSSGRLEIDFDIPWHEVCPSPASVSVTVEH